MPAHQVALPDPERPPSAIDRLEASLLRLQDIHRRMDALGGRKQ